MVRPNSKVVVTGASGALGAVLCGLLREEGYEVVAVDQHASSNGATGTSVQLDLRDRSEVEGLFREVRPNAAIHTAALHGYHLANGYSEDEVFTNNVVSTMNVLRGCELAAVRRIVFTSSTSVYGSSADPHGGRASWLSESTAEHWRDLYDAGKLVGERLCERYALRYRSDVIALRVTRFFDDGNVSFHLRKLSRGVDVRDAARAHMLALAVPPQGSYRAYNIAASIPFRRDEAVELWQDAPQVIERHYPGAAATCVEHGIRLPASIQRVYDISRAVEELAFVPQHNFDSFLEALRGGADEQSDLVSNPHINGDGLVNN